MREKTFDKKEKNALDDKTKRKRKKISKFWLILIVFFVAGGLNVKVWKEQLKRTCCMHL